MKKRRHHNTKGFRQIKNGTTYNQIKQMGDKIMGQIRFQERKALAGDLQPGDCTRYEMVAVEFWDYVDVIVINEGFFDKVTFLKKDGTFLGTYRQKWRKEETNPWTIKAAKEMFDMLMNYNEAGLNNGGG